MINLNHYKTFCLKCESRYELGTSVTCYKEARFDIGQHDYKGGFYPDTDFVPPATCAFILEMVLSE